MEPLTMSEDNHQEKKSNPKAEVWCRRRGIRIINQNGGMEFVPY
jgi:hypothetical protein